ncbi:protein of unknown function [Actinokineospora terrae]|uniref:DUF397 domain-containing protein n=1 Tax=Actinokineospora terrae TaxID=155974 RepID=A0A1H9WZ09_9PSEU|nr:protein of unknown function [Actinokineospora terrae]
MISVQVPTSVQWRIGSRCESGGCVAVSPIGVRDTKNPGQRLDLSAPSLSRLVAFARTAPGIPAR